jgi:hypothetical protein
MGLYSNDDAPRATASQKRRTLRELEGQERQQAEKVNRSKNAGDRRRNMMDLAGIQHMRRKVSSWETDD